MRLGRPARPRSRAAEAYLAASLPGRRQGWRDARWAVVDLETTGLDAARDEILSIGIVPIDGGRIRAGAMLERLARPERMPAADTVRIHGLRPADLAGAPPFDDVLDDVLEALTGRLPVAHWASVERAFLAPALRRRGLRLRGEILDTALLARIWLYEREGRAAPRLQLGALAAQLGLPVHRPHHALGDALTTAQALLALCSHLERRGRLTVGTLYALQERARGERP